MPGSDMGRSRPLLSRDPSDVPSEPQSQGCCVLCPHRYFHCPADSSELAYDPPAVMNADTLSYCQKEAWCKLAFYLLSFFYYLYW